MMRESLSNLPAFEELDAICDRFEAAWKRGETPTVESFLAESRLANRAELFRALLSLDIDYRRRDPAAHVEAAEYARRFPQFSRIVDEFHAQFEADRGGDAETELTEQDVVGRYAIRRKLGAGSFATVYLAMDRELGRRVAVKVARTKLSRQPQDLDILEPKLAAQFEHPHIVPVYDVGRLDDGRLFIVNQFIDGTTLAARLDQFQNQPREAASLVARIARALHFAHQKAVFHRDVTPANILLDGELRPFLTDFGLALRAGDHEATGRVAGTPAYMSPEQARGEIHLVDGRSDVFSLCAVFYEMLTGARPFPGSRGEEVLDAVLIANPIPPRQLNDRIPRELERVIQKGLQKQASHRYASAEELAEDLEAWLSDGDQSAFTIPSTREPRVRPRGLEAFEEADFTFFHRLIPGPRTRQDTPESIEYWRARIEARGEAEAFRIGVLYGPSGSGKSSFFRAGLRPCLRGVKCCFVQATGTDTEQSLQAALRELFPGLARDLDLTAMMRQLRTGDWLDGHEKLLIVLDQFEQWLGHNNSYLLSPLITALRQCDGAHTQAFLLVRDDFWAPLSHCMQALDVELDRHNHRLVDSFTLEHAKTVLLELGYGYGCLADVEAPPSKEFAQDVVHEMTADGDLIPVRLSVFAAAFQDRPWTAASLAQSGGVRGVLGSFVDRLIHGDPLLSRNSDATVRVLRAMVPANQPARDQPKAQRTIDEISSASGIDSARCDEIVEALESRARLVTTLESAASCDRIQLAHDYLVPIVREWTDRRLGATRYGRAEMVLRDHVEAWESGHQPHSLPSKREWLQISLFARRTPWSPAARLMMQAATRRHVTHLVAVTFMVLMAWGLTHRVWRQREARNLLQRLEDANTLELPTILSRIERAPAPFDVLLKQRLDELSDGADANASTQRRLLHLHLAALNALPAEHVRAVAELTGAVGSNSPSHLPRPTDLPPVISILGDHLAPLADDLERVTAASDTPPVQRLRAAAALAASHERRPDWPQPPVASRLVDALIARPPVELATWITLLAPVKDQLVPALGGQLNQDGDPSTETARATAFAAYANTPQLVAAVADASPRQLAILVSRLADVRGTASLKQHFASLSITVQRPQVERSSVEAATSLLRDHDGAVSPTGAFAQAIHLSVLDQLISRMSALGFQLHCFRPYDDQGHLRFAATWLPGDAAISYRWDLDPDEFAAADNELSETQHELIDLTGYEQDGNPRFAGLWRQCDGHPLRTRFYVDADSRQHARAKERFAALSESMRPVRMFTRVTPEGKKRYSAIWKEFSRDQLDNADPYGGYGEQNHYPGYLMRDRQMFLPRHLARSSHAYISTLILRQLEDDPQAAVAPFQMLVEDDAGADRQLKKAPGLEQALRDDQLDILFATTWTDTDDRETVLVKAQAYHAHRSEAAEHLEQSLYPESISVRYSPAEGGPIATSVWHRLRPTEADFRRLASRQANLALGLCALGHPAYLERVLDAEFGRQAASYAVHRLVHVGISAPQLISLGQREPTDTLLYYLILALAEFDLDSRVPVLRFVSQLDSADPAVISAIHYCCRAFGTTPPALPPTDRMKRTAIGNLMIRLSAPPEGEVMLGAPTYQQGYNNKQAQCIRPLARDYWISNTETSIEQFNQFLADEKTVDYYERNDNQPFMGVEYVTGNDCPQIHLTYFDAVLFCQWLSELEGVTVEQQCYPGIWDTPLFEYVMPENALARSGYRLPTEAEWENACRAGSAESRHFGSDQELVSSYAWNAANSENLVHPVGTRRPNEFGCFDMLGNVLEWCHEPFLRFCDELEPSHRQLTRTQDRSLRGGDFRTFESVLISAYRAAFKPTGRGYSVGFRIARTADP